MVCTLLSGCKPKNIIPESEPPVILDEQSVVKFAKNIADAIVAGNANALNEAFDKEHLREVVSQNSVVYSSFDIPAGRKYFEAGLQQGTLATKTVNEGGDFAFVKYYFENNQHHAVFREYNDYNLNFADYIIDTVDGKLKIKDGFLYNTGFTLSKNLQSGMLYNLLLHTNPDGEVRNLRKAELLTRNNKNREALKLLSDNKTTLKDYVLYWQLYIANLYKTDSVHFVTRLDELAADSIDTRHVLLHKLFYYFNAGNVAETDNVINQLIPYSGDDPIYLLFAGKSRIYAHQYKEALDCLEAGEQPLPLLWDLWYSELECFHALNDSVGFKQCLSRGRDAYGMNSQNLQEIADKFRE